MAYIEFSNVIKAYGTGEAEIHALDGASFTVERGELAIILGASGAGKTTALNILGGMDTATSGSVTVDGRDISHANEGELVSYRRADVGFVFQFYNLVPNLTALENVELATQICPDSLDPAETLVKVGLEARMDNFPAQLSGGEQQRVAIARALATNPKIILCDEATSALDPTTTTSILNLLREINRKMGITIVIITHEMSVVESTCTHVAIIDDGRLAECGTVESVFSQPKSAAAKKLIFRTTGADSGAMGERMIRIVFEGSSADEPTISDLAMQCHVAVNIRYADTREVSGKLFGQMILQLPEDHLQQEKAIYFLQNKGLRVEEVTDRVHG